MTQQGFPTQPTVDDRILQALRYLIREEFPQLNFIGRKAYVIQAVSGTTVDVAPVDSTKGLPSLPGVPLSPYLGVSVKPQTGTPCCVEFLNNDPARPIVTSFDASPSEVHAGGTGGAALAFASPVSGLITALTTFNTALASATSGAADFTAYKAAAAGVFTALGTSLGTLGTVPTTVLKGT